METGLLYLFTTIAQCLAGAIALLAAFALYRLQSINSAMTALCELLEHMFARVSAYVEVTKLQTLRAEGRYEEFIIVRAELAASWENATGRTLPEKPNSEAQASRLSAIIAEHRQIKTALNQALIATGIVMTGSIAALPFVHRLACPPETAWLVAIIGVIGFVGCLAVDFKLIRSALKGR